MTGTDHMTLAPGGHATASPSDGGEAEAEALLRGVTHREPTRSLHPRLRPCAQALAELLLAELLTEGAQR